MKAKVVLLVLTLSLFSIAGAWAQAGGGGGFQRRTVEERVKAVMDKLGDLKLNETQTAQTDSTLTALYKAQQTAMEEMRASGGQPDREKMRETMQKLNADRDEKLKKIFTEEQFKKWKDEVEPSLRAQRGGNGGNGREKRN